MTRRGVVNVGRPAGTRISTRAGRAGYSQDVTLGKESGQSHPNAARECGGLHAPVYRIPPLTTKAVSYTWEQLLCRAGAVSCGQGRASAIAGIDLLYEDPEDVRTRDKCIVVVPCADAAWGELLTRKPHSLTNLPMSEVVPEGSRLECGDSVPVVFWGKRDESAPRQFVERQGRRKVIFYADMIAATFFMLSRWEETVVMTRDGHGRFPAQASAAFRQGFLNRPIVDEYALILGAWIEAVAPGSISKKRRFSVKLSHDIDHVRASARNVGGDLLRRGSIRGGLRGLWHLCRPSRDPYFLSCFRLAEISEHWGFNSSFYFKGSPRSRFDSGYDPNRRLVQRCLRELARRGHELGFHPGYRTFQDFRSFLQEKSRIGRALGQVPSGGRQHYLRFDVSSTWKFWEEAGLAYDSTVGYADHEGFRCGTCHPYRPFMIAEDREYRLTEIPLIVMDGTLRSYRSLTPQAAEEVILTLAKRCECVGGVFTLLWHNSSTVRGWEEWFVMYRRVVGRLAAMVSSN